MIIGIYMRSFAGKNFCHLLAGKLTTPFFILRRGEKLMDPKIEGRLRCRYVTNNEPFYFFQPLKMEEAFLKPLLVIYHDVISDEEIETVKKLAYPRVSDNLK